MTDMMTTKETRLRLKFARKAVAGMITMILHSRTNNVRSPAPSTLITAVRSSAAWSAHRTENRPPPSIRPSTSSSRKKKAAIKETKISAAFGVKTEPSECVLSETASLIAHSPIKHGHSAHFYRVPGPKEMTPNGRRVTAALKADRLETPPMSVVRRSLRGALLRTVVNGICSMTCQPSASNCCLLRLPHYGSAQCDRRCQCCWRGLSALR